MKTRDFVHQCQEIIIGWSYYLRTPNSFFIFKYFWYVSLDSYTQDFSPNKNLLVEEVVGKLLENSMVQKDMTKNQQLFPNWWTKLRKSPSITVHQMSSHPADQVAWNVDFGGFLVALHVLAQKPGAMGRWEYGDGEKVHGKITQIHIRTPKKMMIWYVYGVLLMFLYIQYSLKNL